MAQEQITNLIRTEAQNQGVNPDLAVKIANVESGLNPAAQNPKSSAAGLFQLIDRTRKELGGDPKKKYDPLENVRLGVQLIKQNEGRLMTSLGRRPTDHELYMAHLFGPTGAVSLIQADPTTPVQKAVLGFSSPKTAEAIVKNNRLTGTVGDVIGKFQQKFGGKPQPQQKTAPAKQKPAAPEGPIPFTTGFDFADLGPSYQAAFALASLGMMGGDEEEEKEEEKEEEVKPTQVKPSQAAQMLASLRTTEPLAFADGGTVVTATKDQEPRPTGQAKSMLDRLLEERKRVTGTLPGMGADIAASILNPAYGTAASAADLEIARREGDVLGMGLAGVGMVPVFGGMVRGGGKLLQRIGKEGAEGGGFGSKQAIQTTLGEFPQQIKQAWSDLTDENLYKDPKKFEEVFDRALNLGVFNEQQVKSARQALDLYKKNMIDQETLDTVMAKNIITPLTNIWIPLERKIGQHIDINIKHPPKK